MKSLAWVVLASGATSVGCSLVYPFSEFSFRADAAPVDVVTDAPGAKDVTAPDAVLADTTAVRDALEERAEIDVVDASIDAIETGVDAAAFDAPDAPDAPDAAMIDASPSDALVADALPDRAVDIGPAPCATGQTRCLAGCVSLTSDSFNCGACANACPTGVACVGGVCRCGAPGRVCCGDHCGDGVACVAGQCVRCPIGTTACGDRCRDVLRDPEACGLCGVVCGAGTVCRSGMCLPVSSCTLGPGASCTDTPGNCCGTGFRCSLRGTCCATPGTLCTSMIDRCCPGSECQGGACCLSAAEPCTRARECCSGVCADFFCG